MKILIVGYLNEAKEVKEHFPELDFDKVVNNHPSSVNKLEGVRISQVLITPGVLSMGVYPDILDRIYSSLHGSDLRPYDVIRVL